MHHCSSATLWMWGIAGKSPSVRKSWPRSLPDTKNNESTARSSHRGRHRARMRQGLKQGLKTGLLGGAGIKNQPPGPTTSAGERRHSSLPVILSLPPRTSQRSRRNAQQSCAVVSAVSGHCRRLPCHLPTKRANRLCCAFRATVRREPDPESTESLRKQRAYGVSKLWPSRGQRLTAGQRNDWLSLLFGW